MPLWCKPHWFSLLLTHACFHPSISACSSSSLNAAERLANSLLQRSAPRNRYCLIHICVTQVCCHSHWVNQSCRSFLSYGYSSTEPLASSSLCPLCPCVYLILFPHTHTELSVPPSNYFRCSVWYLHQPTQPLQHAPKTALCVYVCVCIYVYLYFITLHSSPHVVSQQPPSGCFDVWILNNLKFSAP